MSEALGIFVKNPVLGHVKTRIAKDCSDKEALDIYMQLQQITRDNAGSSTASKYVFYDSFLPENDLWPTQAFHKTLQAKGGLGEKLFHAFKELETKNHQSKIIIGSDCPYILPNILNEAFLQLQNFDTVIGPADDGGYYLLGLKQLDKIFFKNIPWSQEDVFAKTVEKFESSNTSFHVLPRLSDIDFLSDWKKYLKHIK